jgi:hypothetical protein
MVLDASANMEQLAALDLSHNSIGGDARRGMCVCVWEGGVILYMYMYVYILYYIYIDR